MHADDKAYTVYPDFIKAGVETHIWKFNERGGKYYMDPPHHSVQLQLADSAGGKLIWLG